MSSTQQRRTNGNANASKNGNQKQPPRTELEAANEIIGPTSYEDLLQEVNLGTGNYDDDDISMQMRSFRSGLVAEIAFSEVIYERAIYETKIALAESGFTFYDEESSTVKQWDPADLEDADKPRYKLLQERAEEIWEEIGKNNEVLSEMQATALAQEVGIDEFRPVFWRMLAAYHETTKSRGGRTQDNFFGRVKKRLTDSDDDSGRSLFSRGGGE